MHRIRFTLTMLTLFCLGPAGVSFGQNTDKKDTAKKEKVSAKKPESPRERVNRRFAAKTPPIGAPLPDVSGYDADGKPFKLRSLQGNYSVLVFGCLT